MSEPAKPADVAAKVAEAKGAGWRAYHVGAGLAIGTILGFAQGLGQAGDRERALRWHFMLHFMAPLLGSIFLLEWKKGVLRVRQSGASAGSEKLLLWLVPWIVAGLVSVYSWMAGWPSVMFFWGILLTIWSFPIVHDERWPDPLLWSGQLLFACAFFYWMTP